MALDPRKRLRAKAYTWIVAGKLGTSQIPHVFIAGRSTWLLDKEQMKLHETEIAVVQSVPGGKIEDFLNFLFEYEKRVKDKDPAKLLLLADVTRSVEIIPALWRKTPDAIPIKVPTRPMDEWSHPIRICGRPLILSRLQLWISDKKLVTSLPENEGDDPHLWNWTRVKSALSGITATPARLDEDSPIEDDSVLNEDVVTCIAMLPWWAESEQPTPYIPDTRVLR